MIENLKMEAGRIEILINKTASSHNKPLKVVYLPSPMH